MPHLPHQNRHEEDWNPHIRRHKIRRVPIPLEKDRKPRHQRDDGRAHEAVPRRERLPGALPRQRLARHPLRLHRGVEPYVAEAQRRPRDQPRHGAQVHQPGEGLRRAAGPQAQVRERAEQPRCDDGHVRHAVLPRASEELRELPVGRHGDDHAGADPAVRVSGRPRGDEDAGVYDGGQDGDAGLLDGDDPGGGIRVAGAGDEVWGGRRDDHADEEGAEDVEEGDAVGDVCGGLGDRLVGVYALAGGDDDDLDADEGEGRVDEGREEPEEVPCGAGDAVVVVPRAGGVPVAEADGLARRSAPGRDDEGDDDEPEEAGDFDDARGDLGFAEPADAEEVDQEDEDETDGDDHGGGEVRPVADEDGGRGRFGGDGDGVAVAVADGEGESDCGIDEAGCKVRERAGGGDLESISHEKDIQGVRSNLPR